MLKTKKKKIFKSLSIANRITILYGAIFSLSIFIISVIILGNSALISQSMVKEELLNAADDIEEHIKAGGAVEKDSIFEVLGSNKYVEFQIVDIANHTVVRSSVGKPPPFAEGEYEEKTAPEEAAGTGKIAPEAESNENRHLAEENTAKDKAGKTFGKGDSLTIESNGDRDYMMVQRMIPYNNMMYFLQVSKLLANNNYLLTAFGARLIVIDIICIILAFIIGRYISRLILKPVASIRSTAERISIEDLSQRIDIDGPNDEMKELSVTFNSMIDRLETSFKQQNQFVSDASHELRTPVSVIEGYANLINRWGKGDPEVLQESIDSIISETEHMSTLIKKLLFLAKADQKRALLQKENLELNIIAQDAVKEAKMVAAEKEIEYVEKDKINIFADGDLIKQLLWIYLENAIKYTRPDGKITVSIYKEGDYGCVSVKDDGQGINEEDLPKIFDRFYRADKSRNKEISGTGLGLSIAAWIVQNHDAETAVESSVGHGSNFITKFKL